MKLIMATLTALISLVSFKSNAQDIRVSSAVVDAFNTSFQNTSNVSWKRSGDYMKADFNMNGQYVTAFYNQDAALVAVTKNITSTQLPVTLQASLKKGHESYWISDLFELSNENGTTYYATLENSDTKLTLKSTGIAWTTYKKSRKS